MEQVNAELARVTAEHRRLQKQAFSRESRLRARRERALRVGTIAFCHDPTAGSSLATAILRKYGDCVALDAPRCVAELENRFLKAPMETLAQWLDWEGEVPEQERLEGEAIGGGGSVAVLGAPPEWHPKCIPSTSVRLGEEMCPIHRE